MNKKIWEYSVSKEFTPIRLVEFSGRDVAKMIYGNEMTGKWKNIWVYPIDTDVKELTLGDFIWLPFGMPVLSVKAVDVLKPLIASYVEFLPLRWYPDESRELYGVNVLPILDCMDEEKSDLSRSKSTNKILSVQKFVFVDECIDESPIFHIIPSRRVFVNYAFKKLAEDAGLVGLDLKEVGGK